MACPADAPPVRIHCLSRALVQSRRERLTVSNSMSRIQTGSVRLRSCVTQPSFWEFRFRLTEAGVRRLKAIRLGTVEELPTKAAARVKVRELNLLATPQAPRPDTVMAD